MGLLNNAKTAKAKGKRKKHSSAQDQNQGADAAAEQAADSAPEQNPDASDGASDEADTSSAQAPQPGQSGDDEDGGDDGANQTDGADGDESSQGSGDQSGSPDEDDPGEPTPAGGPQATGDPGSPADDTGVGPAAGVDLTKLPIAPALQEAYQQANQAIMQALYEMPNDSVAQAIIRGIIPNGPHKIESVARAAVTLIVQVNKKQRFSVESPQIVMPLVESTVGHILNMAEQVKGIQYSDQEAAAALGVAHEMILRIFGVSQKQMAAVRQHVPQSMLQESAQKYHATLKATAGARPQLINGPQQNDQQEKTAQDGTPGSAAPAPGGALAQGQAAQNAQAPPPPGQQPQPEPESAQDEANEQEQEEQGMQRS